MKPRVLFSTTDGVILELMTDKELSCNRCYFNDSQEGCTEKRETTLDTLCSCEGIQGALGIRKGHWEEVKSN